MIKIFKNSKKNKFLNKIFESSRKRKFKNRLKYGQDEQPIYNTQTLTDALMVGDEEKASIILHEIVKREVIGK